MHLGGDRTYYGVGSDCMSTYDLDTGEHRKAVLQDVVNGVRLRTDGDLGPAIHNMAERYLGIELEVNQAVTLGPAAAWLET